MQGISSQVASVNSSINADPMSPTNRLQVNLLKKALEAQKSEASDLMSMLEGKGKIVDIRA
jgi:hypothetical protein